MGLRIINFTYFPLTLNSCSFTFIAYYPPNWKRLKDVIISQLINLLANNVIGAKQFLNRFNGFIGELDFYKFMDENKPNNIYLDGGTFIPVNEGATYLNNPVYFTVTCRPIENYIELYEKLSKISCKAMYIIKWDEDVVSNWGNEELFHPNNKFLSPNLVYYKFENNAFVQTEESEFLDQFILKKGYIYSDNISNEDKDLVFGKLSKFPLKYLLSTYVQRFVFDGLIGLKYQRGIPSDIDQVLIADSNKMIYFIEVKEKDLSKKHPIGFGMDIPRIAFFQDLLNQTGIETYYFVKQIDNQTDRRFVDWRVISVSNFVRDCEKQLIVGGTGMRSTASINPTRICLDRYFKIYK